MTVRAMESEHQPRSIGYTVYVQYSAMYFTGRRMDGICTWRLLVWRAARKQTGADQFAAVFNPSMHKVAKMVT